LAQAGAWARRTKDCSTTHRPPTMPQGKPVPVARLVFPISCVTAAPQESEGVNVTHSVLHTYRCNPGKRNRPTGAVGTHPPKQPRKYAPFGQRHPSVRRCGGNLSKPYSNARHKSRWSASSKSVRPHSGPFRAPSAPFGSHSSSRGPYSAALGAPRHHF